MMPKLLQEESWSRAADITVGYFLKALGGAPLDLPNLALGTLDLLAPRQDKQFNQPRQVNYPSSSVLHSRMEVSLLHKWFLLADVSWYSHSVLRPSYLVPVFLHAVYLPVSPQITAIPGFDTIFFARHSPLFLSPFHPVPVLLHAVYLPVPPPKTHHYGSTVQEEICPPPQIHSPECNPSTVIFNSLLISSKFGINFWCSIF